MIRRPYLDLIQLNYDEIGIHNEKFMNREEVKKYLNIHKKNHVHDALEDEIKLKYIFKCLEETYYAQALL